MRRLGVAMALLLAVALLGGCRPTAPTGEARVLLDGQPWNGASLGGIDDLRVYITLDGAALIDLPFGEPRTVEIIQSDGAKNTVSITGDAVTMESANCENQDCVQMGAVTRENLELRVMGGFIICLPHKISVEVREK
ncbi:MAG: NusG domain II-containing protein [bacterium]